jgi:hypothetical protein
MRRQEKGSRLCGGMGTTGGLGMEAWTLSGGLLSVLRSATEALGPSLVAVLTPSS